MEYFEKFVSVANGIIWSDVLIYLLLTVGIYFSVRMRFFQVRLFREMLRVMFKGEKSSAGISPFQALAVSLSGRVGTGNIAGVATAIFLGGPGAVFWMWAVAFLGASSAFIESTLAQIYKRNEKGLYRGGPAFYIEKGFKNKSIGKVYAIIFAIATILATGLLLPGVQANSIASAVHNAFFIDHTYIGILLAVLLGLIIFGGIKTIAWVAEFIVPFMAIAYVLISLIVVVIKFDQIPEVFGLIFSSAFGANATFGGIVGAMISIGVKRGVYSNEAGQGTGPHPAAAAEVTHPVNQGLVQAFSVYIDTLLVCSATAFMILVTGMYNVKGPEKDLIVDNGVYYMQGGVKNFDGNSVYTQAAIDNALSGKEVFDYNYTGAGSYLVAIALFFFAFTTLMAYYYIAETNVAYLTHKRGGPLLMFLLKIAMLISVYFGAVKTAQLAWDLGDLGVGLMAWLNIIAILILQKPAIDALKDYERQKKEREEPVFNPEELGIKDADFWAQK
ncbi:alanine/glycine:cation symporter family protein [Chryseosolibacter indicus]|uniref:Sodium:alanine symporter family protein n=1 Tax=Chryseosolibacter indicus TaxID=2782351 RepID=A0ABS5VQ18_9BACT|nr:alanine/glycine:cation symporter family protein [Chryseosolibacter indicus]MBT1702892.1 sodium:alanine symporter family protein [Chryseosolibacter indicus]